MKPILALLLLPILLNGCREDRYLETPEMTFARLGCGATETFGELAQLSIGAVEKAVVATGAMSDTDIAQGKTAIEAVARQPINAAIDLAGNAQRASCELLAQQIEIRRRLAAQAQAQTQAGQGTAAASPN